MPKPHRVRIIAKQRPYDEAQWQRLLTAFAYVLHERRTAAGAAPARPSGDAATEATEATEATAAGGAP